ncbi:MAG TPA: EAL domain-containing protein, partial [Micromonosporaceae bacterium]|nr:EAL domain-containing protein [Micromonosporaceae bacterium]
HARQHTFGPCRGAGFLGLATLAGGLTAAGLPVASPPDRPLAALVGLVATTLLCVLGLLLLPGTAPTLAARLRRAFDGVSIAVSLFFAAWVVLLMPAGGVRPVGLAAALVASSGLAITVLTALRAVRYRPAALLCGVSAAMTITALATLVDAVAGGATVPVLLPAGAVLVVAPSLAWAGASRADAAPAPLTTADLDGTFTSYPLLSIPVAIAATAAVYHVVTVGELDATSLGLGAAVGAAVAIREALAAIDVRRYAQRLVAQEAHFRSLVAGSSDVTVVIDQDLVVRWQSPAAARQFGLSDQDVLGRPVTDLVHPEDSMGLAQRLREVLAGDPTEPGRAVLVEARLKDGFGRWRDTESTVSDQRAAPEVGALVVHVRDVGERKHLERTLHRLAFTDQLTGLPNRRELLRTVATLRSVPGRTGAVLVFDLDGVTGVNDVRGREVGDAVLIEVARRLRGGVGYDDIAARLGGDEFAVVTPEGSIEAYGLGMRLLTMLAEPYELPGATVHITASVGLAEVTARDGVDEILYRADLACRRAQQMGGNRVEWYDESLEALLLRRSTLEQSLPGAAARGELDIVYQPIVDLLDRRPVGLEALLRWRHQTLGTVLPGELIPIAEQLGVIGEVGAWVFHTVSRQLSGWLRDGHELWVSVNVSCRQLAAPGFLVGVTSGLNNNQVPAERLTVEVAESGVGNDLATVVTQLAGLRALGVRTALDHFGAGQTSLAYLRRLPVDILKIDSALFLEPPGRSSGSVTPIAPLIDVVVGLGRRLGMEIVAEGLEVEAHLDLVRNAGCRYGEGFLFGRPQPAEHIEAYLESHPTR